MPDVETIAPAPPADATKPAKASKKSVVSSVPDSFGKMDLLDDALLTALAAMGHAQPTLVQSQTLPLALQGRDLLVRAKTGSGKTLAFLLPAVQKQILSPVAGVSALILVPSHALADQVAGVLRSLLANLPRMSCMDLCAAEDMGLTLAPDMASPPPFVVATPARALAVLSRPGVADALFSSLQTLVIDEADLVLSYGCGDDLAAMSRFLPSSRQTMLFSATLSTGVKQLKGVLLRKPLLLLLEERESDKLHQFATRAQGDLAKFMAMYYILKLAVRPFGDGKTLVFVNSVERGYKLCLFLERFDIKCRVLSSDMPARSRLHLVTEFNQGIFPVLIATDEGGLLKGEVRLDQEIAGNEAAAGPTEKTSSGELSNEYSAARGIDFLNVKCVINFDFPVSVTSYTHRVGRTARGRNKEGWALSFVSEGRKRDEEAFAKVSEYQASLRREIKEWALPLDAISAFKYRAQDALASISVKVIGERRLEEIKREVLKSERLKSHFEDNPNDLRALRTKSEDVTVRKQHVRVGNVAEYLLPKSLQTDGVGSVGYVPSKDAAGPAGKKRKGPRPSDNRQKKKANRNSLSAFRI